VETYDIETSKLVEVCEVRTSRPSSRAPPPPGRDVLKTPSDLIAELAGGRGGTPSIAADSNDVPSVQSLLVGAGFASLSPSRLEAGATKPGWLITAGDDRVIRYWDLVRPTDGFVLCGSQREKDVAFKLATTSPSVYYTLPNARPLGQSDRATQTHAANSQRQPLRPHYDAICALNVVETPFSSCVVSADRSGVIKVWRMEGASSRP
jgi:phosphoinositide-3-kinase regulatory subunit 4